MTHYAYVHVNCMFIPFQFINFVMKGSPHQSPRLPARDEEVSLGSSLQELRACVRCH